MQLRRTANRRHVAQTPHDAMFAVDHCGSVNVGANNAKYLHFLKNLSTHDNDVFKHGHVLFLGMRSE